MSLPQIHPLSEAAARADLAAPYQAVSLRDAQRERRAGRFWKFTAVALGALAFFVPPSAGLALVGGCVWAMRRGLRAEARSQVLQMEAVRAAVADLEAGVAAEQRNAVQPQ